MTATANMPLLERLRKGANCVGFLDGAPEPAADVADMLRKAADEIERLQDVKRRSMAIADERAIEAVKARHAINLVLLGHSDGMPEHIHKACREALGSADQQSPGSSNKGE